MRRLFRITAATPNTEATVLAAELGIFRELCDVDVEEKVLTEEGRSGDEVTDFGTRLDRHRGCTGTPGLGIPDGVKNCRVQGLLAGIFAQGSRIVGMTERRVPLAHPRTKLVLVTETNDAEAVLVRMDRTTGERKRYTRVVYDSYTQWEYALDVPDKDAFTKAVKYERQARRQLLKFVRNYAFTFCAWTGHAKAPDNYVLNGPTPLAAAPVHVHVGFSGRRVVPPGYFSPLQPGAIDDPGARREWPGWMNPQDQRELYWEDLLYVLAANPSYAGRADRVATPRDLSWNGPIARAVLRRSQQERELAKKFGGFRGVDEREALRADLIRDGLRPLPTDDDGEYLDGTDVEDDTE